MITISLSGVLILNDDSLTPWTNPKFVSVPGWYSFQNLTSNKRAISSNKSVTAFAKSMNKLNLNFTYDYAIAIVK